MICLKLLWITNHVAKQTMGMGFETWVASHIVEGNNKTLTTPQLVQFLNMQWLILSLEFQDQFYCLQENRSTRIYKTFDDKHS